MSDGGKGDKQRPTDYAALSAGYDRIWGNKKKVDESEDKPTRNNDETQEVLKNISR